MIRRFFFHDVAVGKKGQQRREKMPMPSISSIRRALLFGNFRNTTCERDAQLSRPHLDVRVTFSNLWIGIIEGLLSNENKELCQVYKQAMADAQVLKTAYYSSGDNRKSDSYKAWKLKEKDVLKLQGLLLPICCCCRHYYCNGNDTEHPRLCSPPSSDRQ